MRDSTREFGAILVDNGERAVVQLLRIAPRLNHHCKREGIDDEPQKHVVVQEASQLLDAEPVDIRRLAHRLALLLAEQQNIYQGQDGHENRERREVSAESEKA